MIDWINYMEGKGNFISDSEFNKFYDNFGTHVVAKADFGSKLTLRAQVDWYWVKECNIKGTIELDSNNGWCNVQSDGTRCNLIDGGKTTNNVECGRDKQIVTDLLGSGRGSPGWS